jgi:hypothetical protein
LMFSSTSLSILNEAEQFPSLPGILCPRCLVEA